MRPHFTYYGFRYLKVGLPDADYVLTPDDVVGMALYSDMQRPGYLRTGNEKVNRLLSKAL